MCMDVREDWLFVYFFFFKQKTAYEVRISDWSSDVCSSDLRVEGARVPQPGRKARGAARGAVAGGNAPAAADRRAARGRGEDRDRPRAPRGIDGSAEIGRASCRERVCQYV